MSGTFIINSVVNIKGTPGIMTGLLASRPAGAANGVVFLATDTQQIFSYDITVPGWVMLGGSGGATPNLEQVCTVGETTDTNIRVITPAGNTREISIVGNDGIDNRAAKLLSDQGEDSGYLQLTNKQGFTGTIINDISGSDDAFRFPDKFGAGGTFAMTSDIPAVSSGTYVPTITGNLSTVPTVLGNWNYIRVANIVSVTGQFQIVTSATTDSVTISFPFPTASADARCVSGGGMSYQISSQLSIVLNSANDLTLTYNNGATVGLFYIQLSFSYSLV